MKLQTIGLQPANDDKPLRDSALPNVASRFRLEHTANDTLGKSLEGREIAEHFGLNGGLPAFPLEISHASKALIERLRHQAEGSSIVHEAIAHDASVLNKANMSNPAALQELMYRRKK